MAERDSYKAGTFCWAELLTTDADAAKAFYGELLGWAADDLPLPEGGVYTMFELDGKRVAAMHVPGQEGIPPNWGSYVSVEHADAVAARAKELGATVLAGPFDVVDAGRMATLQDPQGGVVSVWQPGKHHGAQLVNTPGSLTLNQLNTSDPDAAARFYADLFGWDVRQVSEEPGNEYWGIYNGGALNGGMMPLPPDSPAPPHWLAYFGCEDADESAQRIGDLGGQVLIAPLSVPGGRIVVAQDPQGAVFALFEGRFDP